MNSETNYLDEAEFGDGPKCAVVLLLDTSTSMSGARIRALNEGLVTFQQDIQGNDLAKYRVDVAVVTFGSEVEVAQEFTPAADFDAAELEANGSTPMGAGICKALDLVEERKEHYRLNGNPVYRPWIFMITDGEPTDDCTVAKNRIAKAEKSNSVAFWAIGVAEANHARLAEISVRQPWKLNGLKFSELFLWLSNSLSAVSSSRPDDKVALPRPDTDLMV